MMQSPLNRRQLLQSGAIAASMAAISNQSTTAVAAAPKDLMIGMATMGFYSHTNQQLAKELAAEGVQTVQLFLTQQDSNCWQYNGRADVSAITPTRCREIAEAYRSAGVSIHSIGVYTNLSHPDPAERKANLDYFRAMMQIGEHMGVRTFITEAGHFHDPKAPAPAVEYHYQEEVWKIMVEVGQQLAKMADDYDATVLFEPFYRHFFSSAKRTRVYLEELDSPRLRALLDPANLLEVNDLGEMFDQLGPWIGCLHAKDRKLHVDRGVPAGQGDLDYPAFVKLAAERTPHAPLILEYVGAKDYRQALAHLRKTIREATEN